MSNSSSFRQHRNSKRKLRIESLESRDFLSVNPLFLHATLSETETSPALESPPALESQHLETSFHVTEKAVRDENNAIFHLDEFLDDIAEQIVQPIAISPISATISPLTQPTERIAINPFSQASGGGSGGYSGGQHLQFVSNFLPDIFL